MPTEKTKLPKCCYFRTTSVLTESTIPIPNTLTPSYYLAVLVLMETAQITGMVVSSAEVEPIIRRNTISMVG